MKPYALDLDLFKFAYIPDVWDQLENLAEMACPEGWQYKSPRFETTHPKVEILAKYLRTVYRKNAVDFNEAPDQHEEDLCIYMDEEYACFHTGLYTRDYRAIYALFVENIRRNVMQRWIFQAFILEDAQWLDTLQIRPEYPIYPMNAYADAFYLDWAIKVNYPQITRDQEILAYLPEALREERNLRQALGDAVLRSRKLAQTVPDYVAQVVYNHRVQYALPLHLAGEERPDMVLCLAPMKELYYVGHHLMTTEMAYHNARLLGPVRAGWLRELIVAVPQELLIRAPEDDNGVDVAM